MIKQNVNRNLLSTSSKPRLSAVAGRRTYTEDELQNALQDILSGKLGTRRAAVLYGIPRSTLRNKVYKLALEQKREQNLLPASHHVLDDDDDDKEMSGAEDDRELEKALQNSVLMAAAQRQHQQLNMPLAGSSAALQQKFASLYENNATIKTEVSNDKATKSSVIVSHASTPTTPTVNPSAAIAVPTVTPNPWLDPMVLQNLLLTGGLLQNDEQGTLQDLLRNILLQQELMNDQIKKAAAASVAPVATNLSSEHSNNGKATLDESARSGISMIHPSKQNQVQQQQQHQQPQHQHHHLHSRLLKTETPDTVCSTDLNTDASDDAAVILKIPSFKPIAGSSCKNGGNDSQSDTTPHTTPPMMSRSPLNHMQSGCSPPINRSSTESQSPPMNIGSTGGSLANKNMLSLRDVIANSITRTFNQQQQQHSPELPQQHHGGKSSMDQHHHQQHSMEQQPYKRPSISVIKNLGGTDISRFASSPNMMHMSSNSHSHHHHHSSNNSSAAAAAAAANLANSVKGTRPKRGKYRNYDRDSLIEAVKAVQRGEMSVHRAGSYYGVPHSTLEYKVKERHLMRPRKREPKPQPIDTSSPGPSSSHKADLGGMHSAAHRVSDKSKASLVKTPLKTPPAFPDTSPNGLKMNMFDPTQMHQYVPNMFWHQAPGGFSGLPIDFARGATSSSGSASAAGPTSSFPGNAETFFASQIMQRYQEDALRQAGATGGSSQGSVANNSQSAKSAREIAESLYDGTSANGSFLDGIIRHSLDRKSGDIPHGALLDQLVKNNHRHHDGDLKRAASPIDYAPGAIKRERTSRSSSTDDSDADSMLDGRGGMSKEAAVEHLHKYRAYAAQHQQQQQQMHRIEAAASGNGSISGGLRNSLEDLNGSGGHHTVIARRCSQPTSVADDDSS